ncbi:MFS transporter, partial [bacterium]
MKSLNVVPGATISPAVSENATPPATLTRPLLLTMAAACGLAIANLYYNQPLLPQIARYFHVSERQVGVLPMLTQAGFAVGVFLLAPLGDTLERRRLILVMLALVTVSLVLAALSPNMLCLSVASLAIGITSVISTQVLPFAVQLGRPEERGKTVGSIASAMLIGVLLSRTLSGAVGEAFGWRVMYGVASVLMVGLALVLNALLPPSQPTATLPYRKLIRSMWDLTKEHAVLREATLNGMLLYGALSAFWATLVFLVESPAYHYGETVAGMFGLVGALGALGAPITGRLADKRSPRTLVGFAAVAMLVGFLVLWGFGTH